MEVTVTVVVSILVVMMGIFVFMQNTKRTYGRYFLLLCLGVTTWLMANVYASVPVLGIDAINVMNEIAFVSGIGVLFFGYLFTRHFPYSHKRPIFGTELTLMILVVLLGAAISIFDQVSGRAISNNSGTIQYINGEYVWLYVGCFFIAFAGIFRSVLRSLKTKGLAKKYRAQLTLVLTGFGGATLIGILSNIIAPMFISDWSTVFTAPLAAIVLIGVITFAVIRHGLFDVRLAVMRTAAYILTLVTLATLYYVVVYAISVTLFKDDQSGTANVNPVNVFLALVLAFVFQPIKRFFDRVTNKIFYQDRYNTNDFYIQLNEVLTNSSDLEPTLKEAASEIQTALKSEQVFFVVIRDNDQYTQNGTSKHRRLAKADVHLLNHYVEANGGDAMLVQLLDESRQLRRMLMSHQVELVIPLVRNGAIVGYMLLGDQRTGGYNTRDLRVLQTIADELIIAIQHALAVDEVRSINASLQQRIETATAELRRSNARLKRLDETKDEFLSMASHQLRTPLTSIKGYLSMMLEGDIGKTTPMQNKVLGEAYSSSERMVHLIHDFLNVSRLQTGKFMLELEQTDVARVIEEEVKSLGRVAKSRDMEIKFTNKAGELSMVLDDNKIRQVVMNYIDNAIYYSHPESVIKVELLKQSDNVVLKVKDTGIGVPKIEQAHLFGKFFRATNARKQRPDGTGVGLYLAKKVIVAHGGNVLFESKPGKGSTFGFTLPIEQTKLLAKKDNIHKKI